MKNKSIYFIISLISIIFLVNFATPVVSPPSQSDNVIIIGANNAVVFNDTSINLEPDTEYTITFIIYDGVTSHNLIIDEDNDVSGTNLDDPDDIKIGLANDAPQQVTEVPLTWSITWKTPNANATIPFFCGFPGHFQAGMTGTFIIGTGIPDVPISEDFLFPGFPILVIALVIIIGVALIIGLKVGPNFK